MKTLTEAQKKRLKKRLESLKKEKDKIEDKVDAVERKLWEPRKVDPNDRDIWPGCGCSPNCNYPGT